MMQIWSFVLIYKLTLFIKCLLLLINDLVFNICYIFCFTLTGLFFSWIAYQFLRKAPHAESNGVAIFFKNLYFGVDTLRPHFNIGKSLPGAKIMSIVLTQFTPAVIFDF